MMYLLNFSCWFCRNDMPMGKMYICFLMSSPKHGSWAKRVASFSVVTIIFLLPGMALNCASSFSMSALLKK